MVFNIIGCNLSENELIEKVKELFNNLPLERKVFYVQDLIKRKCDGGRALLRSGLADIGKIYENEEGAFINVTFKIDDWYLKLFCEMLEFKKY